MLILAVLFHLMLHQTYADKSVEIELIADYSRKQVSHRAITAFLCWKQSDIFILTQKLHQQNDKIQNINSKITDFHFPELFNFFVLDLSCANTLNILKHANNNSMFREPNHWLLINNTFSPQFYKSNLFKNLDVFVDSKIVLAQRINQSDYYLEYIYKIRSNYDIIENYFAYWINNEFTHYFDEPLSIKRKNLRLDTLRAGWVILNNDSFNHLTDYRKNEIDSLTKLNYITTGLLLDSLNATKIYNFRPTWYYFNTTNQNNTLLNDIITKLIDISGTPFFCLNARLKWYDCLAMTTPGEGLFMFRQPPLSYVKNIYIMPFELKLWLTHIAFYFTSSILLFFVVNWEWKMLQVTETKPDFDQIDNKISDMLLFTMSAICQQGYATEAKGTSGKILMLTIFFTLIFLFTAYAAYTVVLFQTTADDIKDLNDLYKSKIVLGVHDQLYFRAFFGKYTEPVRRKIYLNKIIPKGEPPHFYSMEVGINRMRYEYFAFFATTIEGNKVIKDTFLEHEKCGIRQIRFMDENNPWMVAPKNSSFKKLYKIGYRRLQEYGFVAREIKKRITEKPECLIQGNSYRSAGLIDLFPVYMLLIIGIVASVVILFVEIMTEKLLKRNARRRRF